MTVLFISTLASVLLFLRMTSFFAEPSKAVPSIDNKRAYLEVLDVVYEPVRETSGSTPHNP